MTEVAAIPPQTVNNTVQTEGEYQDRFLEGSQRIVPYDLLEARGNAEKSDDPDAKVYRQAKELFRKGYELCMTIPRSLDDQVLEQHEEDIKTASETMVEAWIMDDKAAPMSERILILGQQYEKVLLKNIPEEEKEGFFVRDSLLFSAWILLVGRQFKHWYVCIYIFIIITGRLITYSLVLLHYHWLSILTLIFLHASSSSVHHVIFLWVNLGIYNTTCPPAYY